MLRKLGFARSLNYALCPKYWTWVKEKRKFSFFLTFDHLTTPIEGPDFFSILNLGFLRFLSREYPPHYLFTSTSFSNGFKVEKTHFWNWKPFTLFSYFINLIWVLPHSNWRHSKRARMILRQAHDRAAVLLPAYVRISAFSAVKTRQQSKGWDASSPGWQ